MFAKILIANRGEIACRVARTARRLGIRTVAVYSDADRDAAARRLADEARRIESYLDIDAVLARRARIGRAGDPSRLRLPLRERGVRRGAAAKAGIVFIGPAPEAIAAMGDKAAAKR